MEYVDLVALIAVFQFLFFGALTGRARGESGLKAPAMTGHPGFERMYRVQMNTLEQLVVFMPALYIAGKYWPSLVIAGIGFVFIVGRFMYWRAYVTDPSKRGPGFLLTVLPSVVLMGLAAVGAVMSLLSE